ncbi:unnamed protein product, partial [marine sediment metagenome]
AAADSWIAFEITALAVAIGDKYRMEVTRPSGKAYAADVLYDGTYWKNNKGAFDGSEFDYTNAMGFVLIVPEYVTEGDRVALPLDLSSIPDVDTSLVEWTEDKPANTDIEVKFAINEDPTTEPAADEYIAAVNGDPIPGISSGDDLTGKWLWAKQELSTTDNTKTPKLQTMREYIYDKTAKGVGPMEHGDLVFRGSTVLSILPAGTADQVLQTRGTTRSLWWRSP